MRAAMGDHGEPPPTASTGISSGSPLTLPGDMPGSRSLTPDEYSHAQAMVTSALASTKSPDPIRSEREIELAEFEMRIRKFNLDLIQPTIRKTALIEHEMNELRAEVSRNATTISDLARTSTKVEQQVVIVDGFREEMGRWDNERRQFQAEAAEGSSAMRQDLDTFRYQLERQDSSIHSVQRTMDRVVGELGRLQDGSDSLRQHVETRLGQQSKLLNSSKTDLEVKLVALEARHNRLSDDLWGEETGLAKVTGDLAKTNDLLKSLSEETRGMRHDKANISQLQAVQEEVNNLMHEANSNIAMLKQTVDTMMSDVKAHFRSATNTVAAHNASMIQEVRSSYQEELSQSAKLRDEINHFMLESQTRGESIEKRVQQSLDQSEEMVRKVFGDVEEVGRLRRRDRSSAEVESKSMQVQISNVHSSSTSVAKCVEHLSTVIWMLLQSDRAASALDLQDDSDRSKVALMGFKDNAKGAGDNPGAGGGARVAKSGGAHAPAAGQKSGQPVISVDHRCLSCSGQAQSVLSGFKMACLQYAPGPVSFAKKNYHRGDLLELREKLLDQAREALQHGPITFAVKDPFDNKETLSMVSPHDVEQSEVVGHGDNYDGGNSSRSSSYSTGHTGSMPKMPPLQGVVRRGPSR